MQRKLNSIRARGKNYTKPQKPDWGSKIECNWCDDMSLGVHAYRVDKLILLPAVTREAGEKKTREPKWENVLWWSEQTIKYIKYVFVVCLSMSSSRTAHDTVCVFGECGFVVHRMQNVVHELEQSRPEINDGIIFLSYYILLETTLC